MIKNIDHTNVIHYGTDSLIIKKINDTPGKPLCIKILNEEFPSTEMAAQLDNEFEICSKIKCSSIRKALSRDKQEDHNAVVFEYIEGTDLAKYMASDEENFSKQLHLAVDLATALAELQKENIFHRRIIPSNILIENGTHKIFIIDFALATGGSVYEQQKTNLPDKQLDILKYLAPEQSGRINRAIDNRADLYSLGIILYQLFTGNVPFDSKEGLELIYAHIAKTPVEPSKLNAKIPKAISDIIMKLLEKNAEDRYQSAYGVKYDLEKGLEQLLSGGNIKPFTIASRDFSGKLYIPEKLYGRDKEIKYLFELFDASANGQKNTVLISGYSGSGKSALVESLQKPVSQKHGFFIKGKFDQISSSTPYSTFVQAFNELIQLILTGDEAYQQKWKKRFADSIGNSGKILTEFIPGIGNLIGKQSEVTVLKGIEAQNRFNYEFVRFIKTIADKNHPLVIFADDLQWADDSSLNLFKLIAESRDIEYVMFIGAYRNNEVSQEHPLVKKITELVEEKVPLKEMEIADLSFKDISSLISDSLHTGQENASFLSDIIFNKTKGNAFYTRQFLKSVYEEGFLHFDFDHSKWQWNTDLIIQMNVSGNVVDLMTDFIQKLPEETLELLETASSIGNRFDKRTLSVVKQMNEKKIESAISIALTEGLLIPVGNEYKFAHDRVQQAIYALIPDEKKGSLHLQNGKRLTAHYTEAELQDKIFDLVNQWNLGAGQITDQQEKYYLAKLNTIAGHKASASAAYPQALQYFEKGLMMFTESDWQKNYSVMHQLTADAADAAYLSAQYEKVDHYSGDLFKHSQSLIDSVKGHEIQIKKLIAQNHPLEAVQLGLEILKKLGVNLPLKPGKLQVFKDLMQTKWLLKNKTPEYFNNLPEMKDAEKNAAMRILSDITSASYFAVPDLVPLLVFKMVSLTVKYGLSRKSPFSFVAFAYILGVFLNEIDKGISFGEIALHLAKKLNAEESIGSIISTNNIFLVHWKKTPSELIHELDKAYKSSLESGDNEFASYAAHNIVYQQYLLGNPLPKLAARAELLYLQIEKFKQDLTLKRLKLFRQSISNLLESTEQPDILKGIFFDEAEMDIIDVTKSNEIYFQNLYIQKLHLALIFNMQEHAKKYVSLAERFQESVKGTAMYPLLYYYRSLAIADYAVNAKVKKTILKQVKKDITQLGAYEKICPQYYSHKKVLLTAEYHYLKGNMESAKIFYDKSLKLATENNMVSDLAICWERAGQFFINTKQDLLANFYLQNAFNAYKRWGAEAKVKQMESRYAQLKNNIGTDWGRQITSEQVKNKPGNIDLESVLKASAALSGEIVLPRLLRKMMQVIMENAGAQKAFLIMEKKGERFIEAEIKDGTDDVKVLHSIPVHQCGFLAESVINYVYLKQEAIILDNAAKSQLFANDDYIKAHDCKSILCIPLINMGKMQGAVYLANDLTYGAFTENRISLLKLLAAQMAISIENALFYSELENKVEERTNELYKEKKKSDDLLLNILPEEIANELKETGRTTPRSYEVATVMFTDFENFTSKSEKLSPEELVNMIDTCFRKFDEIISKYNIEKIKTIGDAYLCVSGLPDTKDHNASNVINAALEIIDSINIFKHSGESYGYFDIRIGVHTGPLVAGVVGDKKFAYDIWGDTVNTAARMEQNSEAGKVNISQNTYELVKDNFHCISRGKKAAKNKGMIDMYYIESK